MNNNTEEEQKIIENLLENHKKFDNFVYFSSLDEAIKELHRRRSDESLMKKVEEFLSDVGIPEPFKEEPRLTIFRQVATPNIEVSRFLIAADGSGMNPLFLEYYDDKFTSNNEWKKFLGKLGFYSGIGKKGGHKITYETIIDFNNSNGKKISEVRTKWDHKLIDFHKSLFDKTYSHIKDSMFFEGSNWFKNAGENAEKYYKKFLSLFICHGILFENFIIDTEDTEYNFSRDIFLPSFISTMKEFNMKPIIVAISPTEIETSEFWLCQNEKTKKWFEDNFKKMLE